MVMSFTMKKMLIYEEEKDMDSGGPISTYEFRYVCVPTSSQGEQYHIVHIFGLYVGCGLVCG